MAFVTLFVPEEFLNIPTHGSIQYHPSLLPAYRGASAINWPIIKGEKETGLSIFWPDNGLDTGAVLLQKKTPISDTDTLGTVYFDRLFPMGVDGHDGVGRSGQGRQGAAHQAGREQGHLRGPLRRRQRPDRLGQAVGADRPADPRLQSGARRLVHARRQAAQDFRRQAAAREGPKGIAGKVGEIAAVDADGFTVVCADGRFKVTRVQPADGKKIEAGEWAKSANLASQSEVHMTTLHVIPAPRSGDPNHTRNRDSGSPAFAGLMTNS